MSGYKILLNDEQQKAVEEIEKSVYVNASAGTGKTAVLVERYLNVLNKKRLNVSKIVAMTFTDRAAKEMRDRIYKGIVSRLEGSAGAEFEYWNRVKRSYNRVNISTIHSYCAKLLREHAYELGLDPNFYVLDEDYLTYRLEIYLRNNLEDMVEANEAGKDIESIKKLLRHYSQRQIIKMLTDLLISQGLGWKHNAIESKDLLKAFSERRKGVASRFVRSRIDISKDYAVFAKEIEEALLGVEEKNAKINELLESLKLLFSCEAEDISYRLLKPIYAYAEANKVMLKGIDKKSAKELKLRYTRLSNLILWRLPESLYKTEDFDIDIETKPTKLLIRVYEMVKGWLLGGNLRDKILYDWANGNSLTFAEMQMRALELVVGVGDGFSSLAIRKEISYLMVDEVQDIDSQQMGLLRGLLNVEGRVKGDRINFFMVGDEKQSIYRFRGADVKTFADLKKETDITINLNNNYRSRKDIISYNNMIFNELMRYSYESYETSYESNKLGGDGFVGGDVDEVGVEILLYEGKKSLEKEADGISKRIKDMVLNGFCKYGEIVLLFRTMTNVKLYANALTKASIPYILQRDANFYKSREIVDSINILKLLNDEEDEKALTSVLRSPFCGIKDISLLYLTYKKREVDLDKGSYIRQSVLRGFSNYEDNEFLEESEREKLRRLNKLLKYYRVERDKLGADELLKGLLERSNYRVVLSGLEGGDIANERLRIFLLKLKDFVLGQVESTLTEVIEYIYRLSGGQDKNLGYGLLADKVILTTIHQSKGMEYPVVIIPDLGSQQHVYSDTMYINDDFGIVLKTLESTKEDKLELDVNILYNYLRHEEKKEDISESKRLLYVAMTRAQRNLILPSHIILEPKGLYDVRTTTSWTDYLFEILYTKNEEIRRWLRGFVAKDEGAGEEYAEQVFSRDDYVFKVLVNYAVKEGVEKVYVSEGATDKEVKIRYFKSNELLERLTPTSFLVYNQCLRKYYYRFVLGIKESEEHKLYSSLYKELEYESNVEGIEGEELPLNIVGNLVHKVLEGYKGYKDGVGDVGIDLATVEKFILICLKLEKQLLLYEEDSVDKVKAKVLEYTKNFLNSKVYKNIIATEGTKAGEYDKNELSFSYKLGQTLLEGIIDKVYKSPEGIFRVIDYKTHKFKSGLNNKERALEAELKESDNRYRVQMAIYWMVVNLLYGINMQDEVESSLYYCALDKVSPIICKTKSQEEGVKEELLKSLLEIERGFKEGEDAKEYFHTRNASKNDCYMCGYLMCENKGKDKKG